LTKSVYRISLPAATEINRELEKISNAIIEVNAYRDSSGGNITILPYAYDSIGQGTWGWALEATQYLYGEIWNTSLVDGDYIIFKAFFAVGTYTCKLFCKKNSASGNAEIKIDKKQVALFDLYSGGDFNYIATKARIKINTAGIKSITFGVKGKNTASSNYAVTMGALSFYRTA
jgi:hypothetical protein